MRRLAGVMTALALMAGPATAAPAGLAQGEHQAVINDVRLWYRVAGPAEGTPVVFLHGGPGQGSQTFARFAGPLLEQRLRMVYLDQRGSGRSERPWNDAYSIDLLVEDVEALRRQWGVEKIAVIGHSFGTILAAEYAARYPQHTERVILTASAHDIPAAMEAQCDRLQAQDPAAYARAVEQGGGMKARCNAFSAGPGFVNANMYPDPATMALVDETDTAGGMKNTGQMGNALFGQGLMNYQFSAADHLTMPVLVIAGGADHQTGTGPQKALARALPQGQYLEYEGRGHFMFVEDPQRFAADVIGFLNP